MPKSHRAANESTEVVADPANDKRQRRSRSTEDKLRIPAEADRCEALGELSALLRREGIYSSHLTTWREQLRSGEDHGTEDLPWFVLGGPASQPASPLEVEVGEAALQGKAPGRSPPAMSATA